MDKSGTYRLLVLEQDTAETIEERSIEPDRVEEVRKEYEETIRQANQLNAQVGRQPGWGVFASVSIFRPDGSFYWKGSTTPRGLLGFH